jgi:putative transposase
MARPLRIEFPGAFYHVTARGNERKPIYRTGDDRRCFLAVLAEVVEQFHLLVHAYVLMDNHYHLLAETLEANLRRAMRELNGTYAQAFNRGHHRVGHLFQGRYKALLVEQDAYLVELSRYIHLNPVRARLVVHAEQYQWSSARAYVGTCAVPRFLTIAEVLGYFGRTPRHAQRRYREFLLDPVPTPDVSPLDKVVGQTLLGADDWVNEMRTRIDAGLPAGRIDVQGNGEIPALRQLRRRPSLDQVISAVSAATGVEPETIRRPAGRSAARAIAIYLAYKTCGLSEKDIGAAFGVGRFAVSKAVGRVRQDLGGDRVRAPLVKRLHAALQGPAGTTS